MPKSRRPNSASPTAHRSGSVGNAAYTPICITGGSGFLGTALLRALIRKGYSKAALSVIDPNKPPMDIIGHVRHFGGNFADADILREALKERAIIVHLGGTSNQATSEKDPHGDAMKNIGGTLALLAYAAQNGAAGFIFPSSAPAVYGFQQQMPVTEKARCNPLAVYGAIKLSIEHFIRYYAKGGNFPYVILRAANVYGPGQLAETHGVVSRFAIRALTKKPIEVWGSLQVARDFVFVDDFIDALLRAIERLPENVTLNIASNRATSLATLIKAVERGIGSKMEIQQKPARAIDMPMTRFDAALAKKHLDWRATTPIAKGVRATLDWIGQNLPNAPQ